MRRTTFAGLTELEAGDQLSTDGFSFQARNPSVIDHFLELGARTHRHDAHAALVTPGTAVTLVAATSGGTLPGDATLAVAYTAVDSVGGETLLSPVESVTLAAALAAPASAPTVAIDHAAGTLAPGTYYYCKTWTDATGGETLAGPVTAADADPGFPNTEVVLGALDTGMVAAGAAGWRLYKSFAGGGFFRLASGTGTSFTDDGSTPADAASQLPTAASTGRRNKVTITLPVLGSMPTDAVSLRVYGSLTGDFPDPSLITEVPIASAGSSFDVTAWAPTAGRPPAVATSVAGAAQIDPDTDLLNWSWKRAVANAGALPALGNSAGDVRVTLDDFAIHVWTGAAWSIFTAAADAWTAVGALSNAWVDPNSADATLSVAYYRDRDRVFFRGVVDTGVDGTAVFTLPVGFRPAANRALSTLADNGGALTPVKVTIATTGVVTTVGYTAGDVLLDGLSFRV